MVSKNLSVYSNRWQLQKVQQSLLLVFARLAVADTPGLLTFLNSTNATQVLYKHVNFVMNQTFSHYCNFGWKSRRMFLEHMNDALPLPDCVNLSN